jgi:hypothetical protein
MPTLSKGRFSINLGLLKLDGELSDEDRQCAWELYTELSTRVAVTGKPSDNDCTDFNGELYIESLLSLYTFFQEIRKIMKKFPVGKLSIDNKEHLGVMLNRIMSDLLRPFLEKWQIKYRYWWENESNPRLSPMERQKEFKDINDFLSDWTNIRQELRKVQIKLIQVYSLIDVTSQHQ